MTLQILLLPLYHNQKQKTMTLTGAEIYSIASTTTQKDFNNLFNKFTEKEEDLFNCLLQLGDKKEVALWTVISERYEETNVEFYTNAFNN